MNNVTIIGNLTADPELRYTTGENRKAVTNFTVAINGFGDKADFIPVAVYGTQAENCDRYLHKGSKVGVQGRLQTGSYENKEGRRVKYTQVIASRVEFLSPRDKEEPRQEQRQEPSYDFLDDINY